MNLIKKLKSKSTPNQLNNKIEYKKNIKLKNLAKKNNKKNKYKI
jgi:hypothetical protein